jgi:predicted adenylyl cyclase CyaB
MRNLEAKYRAPDLSLVESRCAALGARLAVDLRQADHFFSHGKGTTRRLKLREFDPRHGELISYQRADANHPRCSDYLIYETAAPEALREVLAHALGAGPVVAKRRRVYLFGATRIHLDEVEGLGTFVEIETVLAEEADSGAAAEFETVANALGLTADRIVPGAYVDLLAERQV